MSKDKMGKVICVKIQSAIESALNLNVKSIGLAMQKSVESEGGKCLPIWSNKTLTIVIQGITPDRVRELMEPWVRGMSEKGQEINSIVQNDDVTLPQGTLPDNWVGPGSIIRQRLTRKLFLSLPDGAYLVSNLYDQNHRSIFAEQVGDFRTRNEAWKRIVHAGASQRICQVLWTEEEFRKAISPRTDLSL